MTYTSPSLSEGRAWVWPTDIADYSVCPWKVYYRRVLGIYMEATGPMAVGWMEHEAWRRFYSYLDHTAMDEPAVNLLVSRSASEALDWALLGFDHYPSSLRSHTPELELILSKEVSRIAGKLRENAPPESILPLLTEASLGSLELGIRGRVDLVYKSKDGYEPWDIKTGKPPSELLDAYKLQVTAYALLLEANFKCFVKAGGLRFTSLGVDQSFPITQQLRAEVIKITKSIREMLLTGTHPTVKRLMLPHCGHCGFQQTCEEFVGKKIEVRND